MRLRSRVLTGDRLVVVSGAGSGIGRAVARRFARAGDRVVVTDIDRESAKETGALIHRDGGVAIVERLDVTKPAEWERLARLLATKHGGADIVVNNAGLVVVGSFLEHSVADWQRTIDVNLYGVVHGSRVFAQQMVDHGRGGQIVNVASLAAWAPNIDGAAYSVSKTGVLMLSESMRIDLRRHGIGVSAICPGATRTGLSRHATSAALSSDASAASLERMGGLQERFAFASPDLVARAIELAVRFDLAVVPVSAESLAFYALHRLSPGLVREISARVANPDLVRGAFEMLERLFPGASARGDRNGAAAGAETAVRPT
ncbi:SDR family NAD(P)-dependent oxidoreductase [Nocardia crassostreae]|uniref:SDR family NAD(P)-dependent oxidoreductase n=1 Tax=Nocardia crassostreae TaxID=53428 RepID=UPI000A04F77E|nr:SDR family NAD(P)-dependent oxidoreductase [Nocardia crassostreae]